MDKGLQGVRARTQNPSGYARVAGRSCETTDRNHSNPAVGHAKTEHRM